MKTQLTIKVLAALLASISSLIGCSSTNSGSDMQPIQEEPLTYQVFYDNLSPYGTWIDYPGYGHVWNPDANDDFRPYVTNGYWMATAAGWTWISNYKWGWAPFHYGRWLYDDRFGWLWLPGYEWSPAWVVWGTADEYYCWAPLTPEVDVTIIFDAWTPAMFYWNLCPRRHFTRKHLQPIVIRGNRARNGTRITHIGNYEMTPTRRLYYNRGPAFDEVERETGNVVRPIRIEEAKRASNRVSSSDRVRIYRPRIETPDAQRQRGTQPMPNRYRNDDTPRSHQMPNMHESPRKIQRTNINALPERRKPGQR